MYCSANIDKIDPELYEKIEKRAETVLSEQDGEDSNVLNQEISPSELEWALKKTDNDTAINPDENIHVRMVKECGI